MENIKYPDQELLFPTLKIQFRYKFSSQLINFLYDKTNFSDSLCLTY